jgi:hypothetical protein
MKTPEAIEIIADKITAAARQVYSASPFVVYQNEIDRCYAWFWQRVADAQHKHA